MWDKLFTRLEVFYLYQTTAEVEVIACIQGLDLALAHSPINSVIGTDCKAVMDVFKEGSIESSEISIIAKKYRLKNSPNRKVIPAKFDRRHNIVAHYICQFSRRELSGGLILSACQPAHLD
jgi:ribonuclease HI